MSDRADNLDGMDKMITFFREHPEIELPWFGTFNVWVWKREDFQAIARKLGHGAKGQDGSSIHLRKSFGGKINLDLCMTHEIAGCRKIIVGQQWVPENVQIVPAHMEDKVEWVCDEVLLTVEKGEGDASL